MNHEIKVVLVSLIGGLALIIACSDYPSSLANSITENLKKWEKSVEETIIRDSAK